MTGSGDLRLVDFTLTLVAAGNMERCHHYHQQQQHPTTTMRTIKDTSLQGGCEASVTFEQEVKSTC